MEEMPQTEWVRLVKKIVFCLIYTFFLTVGFSLFYQGVLSQRLVDAPKVFTLKYGFKVLTTAELYCKQAGNDAFYLAYPAKYTVLVGSQSNEDPLTPAQTLRGPLDEAGDYRVVITNDSNDIECQVVEGSVIPVPAQRAHQSNTNSTWAVYIVSLGMGLGLIIFKF